jgi:hypothetical protein
VSRTASRSSGGAEEARAPAHLYVYGVVAADQSPPGATGVGDPPGAVRVVAHGELGVLVSDVPGGMPGRREDLEAHQRVLTEVVQAGTVLPMRFGVVMDDEDVIRRDLLDRHRHDLTELLGALKGRVQMTLKGFYEQDVVLREVVAERPDIRRLNDAVKGRPEAATQQARIELGQRVAAAVEDRRAQEEQAIVERLRPLVADMQVDEPTSERAAVQAQLLVDRDRRGELDEAVRRLGEEQAGRIGFRYLGPLPPYSFADLSLDTPEATWD